jgi:FKBP-type peptidyl-prolyl cis-trans isomerase 2
MQRVEKGDLVTVEYEGRTKDGDTFENTAETGPLQFKVGKGHVLPAFEQAVLGMRVSETKIIEIPAENAYGPKVAELVQSFDRKVFGERINPTPGMVLAMSMDKDGEKKQVPGMVTEVSGNMVTIDFNHPLAGQTLLFRITLKAIGETAGPEDGCTPAAGGSCPSSGCGSCH